MEFLEIFLTRAKQAQNRQQLCDFLEAALLSQGFSYWAYAEHGEGTPSLLTNYPGQWVAHYITHNYEKIDPLVDKELEFVVPYQWSELLKTNELSKAQQQIFSEAASVGLNDGVAIPIHEPGGNYACLTLSGFQDEHELAQAYVQKKAELYALATVFHLYARQLPSQCAVTLTPRECECLKWAAQGKSSWEIGMILKVSERTVNFHISNAKEKLGAKTRQQALTLAVAQNIIKLL